MARIAEFFAVLRMYSRHHSFIYSVRLAWGIAFRGLPF